MLFLVARAAAGDWLESFGRRFDGDAESERAAEKSRKRRVRVFGVSSWHDDSTSSSKSTGALRSRRIGDE